jgi:7,8-dihydro-6-hydroxymethylpterin-pyrophosphokinase
MEIEAGRAWKGNTIYRDLIQGMVMSEVDTFVIAVSNIYKYNSSGRQNRSPDYENAVRVADSLYGHSRFRMPYKLMIIGY